MAVSTVEFAGICSWGNAALISAVTANIRAMIQRHPAGERESLIFNMGGLDGTATFIQCPSDAPFMLSANSTGGANFHAANVVAAAIATDHPTVRVMVDAYEMTQFPPKAAFRFHPNVIVRVCVTSEMGYDGQNGLPKELPLTDARNAYWLARLKAWRAAADTVYVWDYTQHASYTTTPLPNYFITAENFKTFHSLGVKGWFAESVCCHPREEMVELKVYLWGRLAFDPTLNATALTEGFLRGFYGEDAAPHVMRYLVVLDSAMRASGGGRPGTPRPFTTNSAEKRAEQSWAWGPYAACFDSATVLGAAGALSQAAVASASNAKSAVRIAQAKTALQFIAFYRWAELKEYAHATASSWPFDDDLGKEFETFVATMNVSGPHGKPITSTSAKLAPDNSTNTKGEVTFTELRKQLLGAGENAGVE